jgi:hypothetical protein
VDTNTYLRNTIRTSVCSIASTKFGTISNEGGFNHPRTVGWGWPTPPHGPWGWIGHPQRPNQILPKKKIVWPVGVGQTTPKGHRLVMGVASTTPYHGGPWGWSGQPKGHLKNNKKKMILFYFLKILSNIFYFFY